MTELLDSPWGVLGIAPSNDKRAIKRAYAGLLKNIDVAQDPQAFIALRRAYDQASRLADLVSLPDAGATTFSPTISEPREGVSDDITTNSDKWHPRRVSATEPHQYKEASAEEPVGDMEQIGKLLNDLDREVNRADENDVEKIGHIFGELTAISGMDNIAIRNIVEQRILNICSPLEGSHYLIILAYRYFAWGALSENYDTKPPLSTIIALYPGAVLWRSLKYGADSELAPDPAEKRIYDWIASGPRPSWNPLFWMRRKKVMKFVINAEDRYPNLLNYFGREKIAPWINADISLFRGAIIMFLFFEISKIWSLIYAETFGNDAPLAAGPLGGVGFLSISVGLYIVEYWRNRGFVDDYGPYRNNIEINFLLPIAGLTGLVFLCGMLPVHWVVALLSLPLSFLLFLHMKMDVLLSPRFNLSYFAERKLPFIILAILLWRRSLWVHFPQILFPSIFLVWAVSRAQPIAKQILHQQEIVPRWVLNLVVFVAAISWLMIFTHVNGGDAVLSPRTDFLFYFTALLIVLGHDLLAFRLSRLDGYLLLVARIFFVFAVAFFHFLPLMLVVIFRSASILANSLFLALKARKNGELFHDSGYGLGSRYGAFRLELLDELIRRFSAAHWITKIFLTALLVRIFAALAKFSFG